MGTTNEHGKLITAAAKAVLLPLGCSQIGRSRSWISDQGFWVIQIEFQPSGWSKGSYLNVGACWLWRVRKGFSFDYGDRVANFIPFESAEQFSPLITELAALAAHEVIALRKKLATLGRIHHCLMRSTGRGGWALYHAAVAAGLVGDVSNARRLFQDFETWANSPLWVTKRENQAALLSSLLEDRPLYRSKVSSIVDECRALNRLSFRPNCLEFATVR